MFSTGDIIAIIVSSVAIVQWTADKIFNRNRRDDEEFQRLREEFIIFRATHETTMKNLTTQLERLEMASSSLQNQIREIMSGGASALVMLSGKRAER